MVYCSLSISQYDKIAKLATVLKGVEQFSTISSVEIEYHDESETAVGAIDVYFRMMKSDGSVYLTNPVMIFRDGSVK